MKILSLNVAGMNNAGKQAGILHLCRSYNMSMLQETKLKRHSLPLIQAKWGLNKGQVFMAGLPNARRGVITIFHHHCEAVHIFHKEDVLGQFLINIAVIKGNCYLCLRGSGHGRGLHSHLSQTLGLFWEYLTGLPVRPHHYGRRF